MYINTYVYIYIYIYYIHIYIYLYMTCAPLLARLRGAPR